MKTTPVLLLAILGLWVQIITGAVLPLAKNESSPETHLDFEGIVPRDPTLQNNLEPWVDASAAGRNFYKQPVFQGTYQTAGKAVTSDEEIQRMVELGYQSSLSELDILVRIGKTASDDQKGADLVSTLFVPNMGYYTASKPKGTFPRYMAQNMKKVANALFKQRGTEAKMCAEAAAIYLFEINNKGWLEARQNRFPDNTKIATYGRMSVITAANRAKIDGNDSGEVLYASPCWQCEDTLKRMNISPVVDKARLHKGKDC